MKSLRRTVLALFGAAALVFVAAAPASADTPVDIRVTADAYALDGSGQITSNSEFLFDSAKGDSPEEAYQIAYRGNLDMTELWASYRLFKLMWLFSPGNNQAKWEGKTFSGNWDISFQVDHEVVTSNPVFVDCSALQSEIELQNPSTELSTFIRCTGVTYDELSGSYAAQFALINPDGSKVTGKQLDENQPDSLHLTTPAQAFFVKQSAFLSGKTFVMTEPKVSGQMRMDAFFHSMMPITFDAIGNDVPLTMVDTFDADYMFESGTVGEALPPEIMELLPPRATMLVEGSTVVPPAPAVTSVPVDRGVWSFEGWAPESAVIDGGNVSFVGTWAFEKASVIPPEPTKPTPPTESEDVLAKSGQSLPWSLGLLASAVLVLGAAGMLLGKRRAS